MTTRAFRYRRIFKTFAISAALVALASCESGSGGHPSENPLRPATATEAFSLRSACVQLGNKFAKDNWKIDPHSHFDVKTARCYVEVRDVPLTDNNLPIEVCQVYDAQTSNLLVSIRRAPDGKKGASRRTSSGEMKDITPDAATREVDSLMLDDGASHSTMACLF